MTKYDRSVTIQMKAIEKCFPVVLFIVLYKMVACFANVDEILNMLHIGSSNF